MKTDRRNLRHSLIAMGMLTAAALLLGASLNSEAAKRPPAPMAQGYAKSLSEAFRYTSRQLLPSVVAIRSTVLAQTRQQRPGGDMESFRRFFEDSPFQEFLDPGVPNLYRPSAARSGIGSGVIIDESGLILTNNHVVAGSDDITITLSDGREFPAVEVKTDPKTDLAILKVEASGLIAARLGDSDIVEVGDWVLALGQPFGLEGTVTAGIISAKGDGIQRGNFLQTDAAINPGNSGGPLVNLEGEVIGINTAIASRSGGNNGIGFAIPVNVASWVSRQLVEGGTVHRSFLGVGIQQMTPDLATQFGGRPNEGVVVTQVMPSSPADAAGIQKGDVILRFADRPIHSPRQLQMVVEQCEPSSTQPVELLRGGKPLKLAAVCSEQAAVERVALTPAPHQAEALGLEVRELSDDVASQLQVPGTRGVVVTNVTPESRGAQAGLRPGSVIVEVNRQPVTNGDEFRAAVNSADGSNLLLLVRSSAGSQFVVVPAE
jgi:serine protease Do